MADSDHSIPPVEIAVECPASLGNAAVEFLGRAATRHAEDVVRDLGLGTVRVEMRIAPAERRGFGVEINGRRCRQPLRDAAEWPAVTDAAEQARRIGRIIHENRVLLISAEIAQALRAAASSRAQGLFLPELSRAEFLDYVRLIVAGCFHVRRHEDGPAPGNEEPPYGFDGGRPFFAEAPRNCYERAVASLSSLSCVLYRAPVALPDSVLTGMLDAMQERLFFDLGVRFPRVRVAPDSFLTENEFRIQINDLRLPREGGLGSDERLVALDPRRLKGLGLSGRAAHHPATGAPAAVVGDVGATDRAKLEGLPLLDPDAFIVQTCSRELRRHAGVFVVAQGVQHDLDLLRPVYRQIVTSAELRFGLAAIAQVLRSLVAEAVSMRHLRGILETMLSVRETEHLPAGGAKAFYAYADFLGPAQSGVSISAVGAAGLADAVRLALRDYIAYQHARGYETLPVYRLADDLEALIDESMQRPLDEDERLAVAEAVWEGVGRASFPPAVVLTRASVRRRFKALIEMELPEVVVLSDEERPPGMKTQILGMIALNPVR